MKFIDMNSGDKTLN